MGGTAREMGGRIREMGDTPGTQISLVWVQDFRVIGANTCKYALFLAPFPFVRDAHHISRKPFVAIERFRGVSWLAMQNTSIIVLVLEGSVFLYRQN